MNLSADTHAIIGAALEVHKELGPGLLESAHQKCLALELEARDDPSGPLSPPCLRGEKEGRPPQGSRPATHEPEKLSRPRASPKSEPARAPA